jgi:hypothetical protein
METNKLNKTQIIVPDIELLKKINSDHRQSNQQMWDSYLEDVSQQLTNSAKSGQFFLIDKFELNVKTKVEDYSNVDNIKSFLVDSLTEAGYEVVSHNRTDRTSICITIMTEKGVKKDKAKELSSAIKTFEKRYGTTDIDGLSSTQLTLRFSFVAAAIISLPIAILIAKLLECGFLMFLVVLGSITLPLSFVGAGIIGHFFMTESKDQLIKISKLLKDFSE